MKRVQPNMASVFDFPSTDEDPDNEIMVVEPDEGTRRRPAPSRAKNRKQREADELDQKLIESGLLSADELVGLSKEEKQQYLTAFEESMATGSTSQETTSATTTQPSPERADARSPEIFGSQAEFAEAEPSVLEPESELPEARPESDEVVPDSQTINLSDDDDSLLTDDNDDDNGDAHVSSTTTTKNPNIARNSREAEATPEKLPTSSTNQRAAYNSPANRKVAYVSANSRAAYNSPAANQKAPQIPDSPLVARKKPARGISYQDDEDEAPPRPTTSANHKRAVEEMDQSGGPMFTFECNNDADWPRSPSPKKMSEKERNGGQTLDAHPLYTPPGYCPREYTQVIVQTFNDYLNKLYKHQCDTLPRRLRWEPVEVGRCHAGTLDFYRKRPRDLGEQLEQYYDWRHTGGVPKITEPGENEAKHTFECDKHGSHSISAGVELFPDGPDSWQDDTPEMEIETPQKVQVDVDRRKRKYEPQYGVLPDLDWEENEEPKTKRKAKAEDSDEDFVPEQKLPRSTRRNAKPSVDITSGYKDKMGQFAQAFASSEPVLQRHSRGGRKTPEMRGGGRNPRNKGTRKLLDPKQTHLTTSDEIRIEDPDDEFESIQRKKGPRGGKKAGIPDSFAGFMYDDDELEPGEIPRFGRGFATDAEEAKRGRRKEPEMEEARAATPSDDVAEEETMNCPICSDPFPLDRIEDHASTCDGTSMAQLKQQQQSFTEERGEEEPQPAPSGGQGVQGFLPRPTTSATTRTLRNSKTVEVHLCIGCEQPINRDQLEAHLAECLPKRDADIERRMRAKMMSEKALERQRSNPEHLLKQALIDVKKQREETLGGERIVLPKVATIERASSTPEKRWRIPLLTPERIGGRNLTPEKQQQQERTVTETGDERVLINVVNPQTSGVKQQTVRIARPEATEKCHYCAQPYPVSVLAHHYDLCQRRPRDRVVVAAGADSQDLNLEMSDHSQEEDEEVEEVQSIEIHDSESSEDEPPPKRPNRGNHGNVQPPGNHGNVQPPPADHGNKYRRPLSDPGNRYQSNIARSQGSQSSDHGNDEISLDTQNSEGWMGKEEGKEKAESGSRRGRLRRTKR